jgi:hypothetical protein
MTIKDSDIPIKTKKCRTLKRHELEDYEPGATRTEVFQALKKVATSPKPCQKRAQPPEPTL